MTRAFVYFLIALLCCLLQTALLPKVIPFHLKPDLLLVLIVFLGLNESPLRGGVLAWAIGCLQDVYTGGYLGLYGLACLLVFMTVRAVAGRLNTESSILLLCVVFCATLLQGLLLAFFLLLFVDAGPLWPSVLGRLLPQALLNMVFGFLLLKGTAPLQRRFAQGREIPGLHKLDSRHES